MYKVCLYRPSGELHHYHIFKKRIDLNEYLFWCRNVFESNPKEGFIEVYKDNKFIERIGSKYYAYDL